VRGIVAGSDEDVANGNAGEGKLAKRHSARA
jgi:hypothetical protein